MSIYTLDNIKEQIIKSNPFWTKYITIIGKYSTLNGRMYITNDDETVIIRIDDSFKKSVISKGLREGDSIRLEGFLNYGGANQKSKDDKETKIQNIDFSYSRLTFCFYPKDVEVENVKEEQSLEEHKEEKEEGVGKLGCLIPLLICLIVAYLLSKCA